MSLTFVGPWNNRLPNIAVISPSGTKYGSRNDDGNLIAQKWSSNVSTYSLMKKKEFYLIKLPDVFFFFENEETGSNLKSFEKNCDI